MRRANFKRASVLDARRAPSLRKVEKRQKSTPGLCDLIPAVQELRGITSG